MYITYTRVSSREQGDSRLSLEEQQRICDGHAGSQVVARYSEVDSGGNCERPQLLAALAECRRHNATLVVATLDRLLRDTAFCCQLLDGDVPFVCADMPKATREWIQLRAVFSEYERRKGSERMQAAWESRKKRPDYIPPAITPGASAKGVAANKAKADAVKQRVGRLCRELRDAGRSLASIAAELNGRGERTSRGGQWSPTAVWRILDGQTGGHAGRF